MRISLIKTNFREWFGATEEDISRNVMWLALLSVRSQEVKLSSLQTSCEMFLLEKCCDWLSSVYL